MCLKTALASWLMLGLAGVAAAQTPPTGPPPRGGRQAQRGDPQAPVNLQRAANQIQEQWNVLVLRQSREFLGLSEQQYPNFFSRMTSLQDVRDRHQRERRRLVMELARMTGPNNTTPPAEATLVTKLRELEEHESQAAQAERTALAALDEVLTPFQRARFRFFEEQMDQRKLQMLAQVIRTVPPPGAQPIGRSNQPSATQSPTPLKPIGRGGGKRH